MDGWTPAFARRETTIRTYGCSHFCCKQVSHPARASRSGWDSFPLMRGRRRWQARLPHPCRPALKDRSRKALEEVKQRIRIVVVGRNPGQDGRPQTRWNVRCPLHHRRWLRRRRCCRCHCRGVVLQQQAPPVPIQGQVTTNQIEILFDFATDPIEFVQRCIAMEHPEHLPQHVR